MSRHNSTATAVRVTAAHNRCADPARPGVPINAAAGAASSADNHKAPAITASERNHQINQAVTNSSTASAVASTAGNTLKYWPWATLSRQTSRSTKSATTVATKAAAAANIVAVCWVTAENRFTLAIATADEAFSTIGVKPTSASQTSTTSRSPSMTPC